jgi:hypothetical protein
MYPSRHSTGGGGCATHVSEGAGGRAPIPGGEGLAAAANSDAPAVEEEVEHPPPRRPPPAPSGCA